ncbi:DUF3987 domain-containing protein [Anaerotruncus sp. AF02-27]|nr:DUF3987 domain-containing protein [Anaerotruncus sp. AF02-27]
MMLSQNQINNIPLPLRAMPQWVTWRYEKRKGQDKPTKVPYNPATGRRASAGQPDTWVDFDTAVKAQGYDGVGYEFNDMGLVGVDIDHCINLETGEVSPAALRVVGLLNSYTEFSPSGTGLHIFVYGDIPAKGRKDPASGIEMYRDVRFLTMTGNPFMGVKPIERRDREIMQLYDELFPEKPKEKPMQQPAGLTLDDGKLIEIAGKASNGEKFRRLYSGDTGGYPSHSEADMALCNYLAFYTGKDPAQMDRLFRASGLMRPKWDEKHGGKTYGASTIEDAIGHTVDTFGSKPTAAEDFAPVTLPQGWEPPIPFDSIDTPDFPTESLPGPLTAFVECLSESTQTPEEMPGILSLGVLATAFQSKYEVEITSDWREPLCLYTVAVAPPGERKSAVISALSKPVYEYEAERRELEAAEIAQNQTERALLEKALQAAQNNAAKKKGSFEAYKADALELSAQLAQFQDKYPFRLLVDDTTQEKLIDIMDMQGGCITVASAEGGLFDALAGRYDKGANFDIYLKGHAGDPIMVDRIGRKSNYIPQPRLSMMLTIQPEVLQGLMDNATFRGRGLCGRFLYAMCKSKVGRRDICPDTIPDSIKADYRQFVRRILSDRGQGVIYLSPEADHIRQEYAAYIEQRLGDDWEFMRDWGGKLVGAMVRIAALMHAAEAAGDPTESPISPEVMQGAVKIAEFLGAHAMAAYQVMGADNDYEDAKYLWRRIESTGRDEISKRDLFAMCQGKFKRVEEMEPSLQVLVGMGYVQEEDRSTGGRPSKKIIVNPHTKATKYAKATML